MSTFENLIFPAEKYKTLNPSESTIKIKYPLPLIDSAFAPFHLATIFTKLDLRNAYHLVRIREENSGKQPLTLGHFEYIVMLFGLTNTPMIFQALINGVLKDMLNRVFNIFIFLRTLEEHVQHVRPLLQRLLLNRLLIKAEASVGFPGFIIKKGQIQRNSLLPALCLQQGLPSHAKWSAPSSSHSTSALVPYLT